ncbi:TetR/AcrR family transcriptional regulator [Mycobacterium sp.]|uniref:TetR/AcrR family transcriptional regulator n=1 Tax=Mycobacterium sp. TaxID=1785 RepID=UPI003C768788
MAIKHAGAISQPRNGWVTSFIVTRRQAAVRRAPYGENPRLGALGNRARLEIVAAARELFAEYGYHAVTVEMIGERTGRSGPSVYQYFENKGDIFRIFVDELGNQLVALAATVGDVSAADSLDELVMFVSGLTRLFDEHRVTATEWPLVEASDHRLRIPAEHFLNAFAQELRPQLRLRIPASAGGSRAFAIAMLSIVQWGQYTRKSRMPELSAHELDRYLATLFHNVVASADGVRPGPRRSARPARTSHGQAPALSETAHLIGLRKPVTSRSRHTIDRILEAAAVTFARNGFAGSTIQQIADEARVGKASVYTYWVDKKALFSTLAHNASVDVEGLLTASVRLDLFESKRAGRIWLDDWLSLIARHGAVLHIWTHEVVDDEALGPEALEAYELVSAQLRGLVADSVLAPADGPATAPHPGLIMLWAVLVEFPYTMSIQLPEFERAEIRELLLTIIRRGLLGVR